MTWVHSKLEKQLEVSIEAMLKYYNKKRKSIEPFKKGEMVMLNGKNIHAKHRCRKLEDKIYGPFEISNVGKNERYYKLKLPESWRIHPTFTIALLERYRGDNPKKQVVEIEADDTGWKMESVIASGPSNDDPKKHVYLVKWEGYSYDENTWETYENVEDYSKKLLDDYYSKNPMMDRDGRYGKRKR
jgi:hypothetical protein